MNQKSSLPPGHLFIIISSAFWNVGRIFKHKLSLSLIVLLVISYSSLMYYLKGWGGIFGFILPLSVFVIFIACVVWFVSLFSMRVRKRYLVYKIRRHQLLKQTFKDHYQHQKLNEVIDKYQQHLRAIDEELQAEFGLGV